MITFMCSGNQKSACDYSRMIVITNRSLVSGDYLTQLKYVLELNPAALILREKDLPEEEYQALALIVLTLCEQMQIPCYLHSHAEIAKRLGCRNLHLSIPAFRKLVEASQETGEPLSESFDRISVSCHSQEDVQYASTHGASQIILGTIFETACKKGLPGKGLSFVREICESCALPVYAIGGITPEKLPQLLFAGAAGGCMMSGFMQMKMTR